MITLYQLHWSHYVEKVRWALDFKRIEWQKVEVEPFSKTQMSHLPCKTTLESGQRLHTAPTIHDDVTGAAVSDSSKIIEYLEQTYPTPALFPQDAQERAEVTRWMLWLDSTLGLGVRKLAYTQIALEHPGILAELFVPGIVGNAGAESFKAKLAGSIIAGVLTRRFRFLHLRADRVFEKLENCLLICAERLSSRPFLVGDHFTAADLTLAALLRPALLVPWFRDHPRLQGLFEWRAAQAQEHRREKRVGYEAAMHAIRQRRGWDLGAVSWLAIAGRGSAPSPPAELPTLTAAINDQQSVGRFPRTTGFFTYLKLKRTCGFERTSYARSPGKE